MQTLSAVRDALAPEEFDREFARGEAMNLDQAVECAVAGDTPPAVRSGGVSHGLSAREREVAALVARGCTNRAIAERTAEGPVECIGGKLGFQSRAQIAASAVQQGLMAGG